MICDRISCRHVAGDHGNKAGGCLYCNCPGFVVREGEPTVPTPPVPEDVEQYLNTEPMPPLAAGMVSLIEGGYFDRYLELILNAAHNRKRAMRGTPGFRGRAWRGGR